MIPVGILTAVSGSNYDPDALAFFGRVTAAGGTLSNNEKTAVNTLVLSLKSAGLWSLMKALYPMVGASAASCAQNLISASFTGSFVNAWAFNSTGATPLFSTASMNTNLNPNGILNYDSFHISYYSRTQDTSNSGSAIGQGNGGNNNTYLAPYYAFPVNNKFFLNGNYPSNAVIINNTITTGLILGNKEAINSRKIFLNSTLLATNTTSHTNSFNNNTFYLAAVNYGTPQFNTSFECAFSSIGDGLTNTQVTNLYTAVQAFQTTLSRQV